MRSQGSLRGIRKQLTQTLLQSQTPTSLSPCVPCSPHPQPHSGSSPRWLISHWWSQLTLPEVMGRALDILGAPGRESSWRSWCRAQSQRTRGATDLVPGEGWKDCRHRKQHGRGGAWCVQEHSGRVYGEARYRERRKQVTGGPEGQTEGLSSLPGP